VVVALDGLGQRGRTGQCECQPLADYAALLLLLVVLISRPRHASVLLAAAGVGITIVALTVLVRMLGSDPGALFIAGRLNSPLGYINGEGCVFAMGAWFGLALAERRQAVLAGLGSGLTVAMACLALLSQSRGAAIATSSPWRWR